MKKILALLGLVVLASNAPMSQAAGPTLVLSRDMQVQMLLSSVAPLDLINWKVGDSAELNVSVGSFGKLGTMHKEVSKEEGAAIWVVQNIDLAIQKEKVEMLMNRADGKILKMIHNGKEEAVPEDKVEIISQDYTEVTVPAGTFKAIHIVAKTKQVDHVEVWANPRDTVMDGTLKQSMKVQGMDIVMELASFKHAQ